MNRTIIFTLYILSFAAMSHAQYAASVNTGHTAGDEMNAKMAHQVAAGVPSGNCAMGKVRYLNSSNGDEYACTATNTWTLKGATGSAGASGQGYTWRGAYAGGTAYAAYDTVSYSGSTYVCILASTGNLPTNGTYFSLAALKGDTGASGSGSGDMLKTDNLSGLGNYSTARSNLGLGGAALLDIGTTSGTVAAGNDTRMSNARSPTGHGSTHQNGGTDEIATATPGANAIPKAGSGGTLAVGWIPTLNQSTSGNAGTASALSANGSNCSAGNFAQGVDAYGAAEGCTVPAGTYSLPSKNTVTKVIAYEVGTEDGDALTTTNLTNHAIEVNDANAKTLVEASCISDAGSQAVTVNIGGTTLFSITCVGPGTYSASTTNGSTGYIIAASMGSTAVGAHTQLDLSGTANTTTKDVKLHVYGTVN